MARKWRKLASFFSHAATAPLFFNLAPLRRAPPFLLRASAQWRGGVKSGASAQRWYYFNVVQYTSQFYKVGTC